MTQSSVLILAWWTGVAAAMAGLGSVVSRLYGSRPEEPRDWLVSFWSGFALTLFALQVWNLFLPVDGRALAALGACGAAGLLLNVRSAATALARAVRHHGVALLLLVVVAAWLANLCLTGPRNGDSGLYHVPTVRWLAEYAVVPGLGNLHSRLAFNQSWFLYVAMLDVGTFAHRSGHLANGLLVLALFAEGLLGATAGLRRGCAWRAHDVFFTLFLPASAALALDLSLTSPTPDIAVFVIGAVLSGRFLAYLERSTGEASRDLDLLVVLLLAAAGVVVKLSFAMLGLTTVVLAALHRLVAAREGARALGRTAAAFAVVAAAGIGPWLARGAVLSGYPLFPGTAFGLPVDWRVPAELATAEAEFIRMWPSPAWQAFGDLPWLWTFLRSAGWEGPALVVPAAVAAAALLAFLPALWLGRNVVREARVPRMILLPTLAALAFWYVMAPRPRFAGAALWLLAVQLVLLVVDRSSSRERRTAPAIVLAASLAGAGAYLTGDTPIVSGLQDFNAHSAPRLSQQRVASGLVVNVPEHQMCWDAPLPCTPFVHPGLVLRRDGDLGSGFRLDLSIDAESDEDLVDPAVRLRRKP